MGYEFTSPISSFPVGQFVINSLECHVSGTGPGTGTSSTAHGAVPSHWSSIPLPHSREGWDQHLMLSPLKSPRIPPYPHVVELELILGALASFLGCAASAEEGGGALGSLTNPPSCWRPGRMPGHASGQGWRGRGRGSPERLCPLGDALLAVINSVLH